MDRQPPEAPPGAFLGIGRRCLGQLAQQASPEVNRRLGTGERGLQRLTEARLEGRFPPAPRTRAEMNLELASVRVVELAVHVNVNELLDFLAAEPSHTEPSLLVSRLRLA